MVFSSFRLLCEVMCALCRQCGFGLLPGDEYFGGVGDAAGIQIRGVVGDAFDSLAGHA
jgi:hypothetical protein